MKITKEMLQTVIEQFGAADGRIAYEDAANMLMALADPNALTYVVEFQHSVYQAGVDYTSLVDVIEKHVDDAYIDIYVQYGDTDYSESVFTIGHNQCYYKPDPGVFLASIESDGAGVGLDKVLNDFVAKRDAQSEVTAKQ